MKNRLFKTVIAMMSVAAFTAAMVTPVFASEEIPVSDSTVVSFDGAQYSADNDYNDFLWSVPAKQEFAYFGSDDERNVLSTEADVSITPLGTADKILLSYGAEIVISVVSANGYSLRPVIAESDSAIAYTVSKSDTLRGGSTAPFINGSGDSLSVLTFEAGVVEDSAGITQSLTFATTERDIVNGVAAAGEHADQLTFNMTMNAAARQFLGYSMLNGAHQTLSTASPAVFRSAAPLSEFVGLTIDGEPVSPSNYDIAEGSTIVTLHTDFIDTLSDGGHTISINSEDGSAVTDFTVTEPVTIGLEVLNQDLILNPETFEGFNISGTGEYTPGDTVRITFNVPTAYDNYCKIDRITDSNGVLLTDNESYYEYTPADDNYTLVRYNSNINDSFFEIEFTAKENLMITVELSYSYPEI